MLGWDCESSSSRAKSISISPILGLGVQRLGMCIFLLEEGRIRPIREKHMEKTGGVIRRDVKCGLVRIGIIQLSKHIAKHQRDP